MPNGMSSSSWIDHEPVRRDLVERGQRGDRPAGQVHVGARPGQRDRDLGQPSLGDVAARPVRLEPRADPVGQQRRHHLPDVVPVARVLRSRVAEPGDDPAFCGQPGLLLVAAPVAGVRLGQRLRRLRRTLGRLFFLGLAALLRDHVQDQRVRLDLQGDALRQLQVAGVHGLADVHALDVHVDALRDVRGVGLDRDLHELLVEHPVARGDLAGDPDRHLDGDLLAAAGPGSGRRAR